MKVTTGTGVTSCLSVRLHDVVKFIRENKTFPNEIDSSEQFKMYRDFDGQDVSKFIFGDSGWQKIIPIVNFDHGWQYGWYNEIEVERLNKLARIYCPINNSIKSKSDFLFNEIIKDRTCILYRGNDKALEIPRTHYQAMIEMALDSNSEKFFVQTDEEDFYQFFKERFPDTICFDFLPRINKNPDAYVLPEIGKRADFAVNFIIAIMAISKADKLILNTGNTGLWTMIFRGNTENVWQHHGQHQQWRKL